MMIHKTLLISTLTLTAVARADVLSFPAAWREVQDISPAQEAARLKRQSLEMGLGRAERHWLPRLYLDARTYQTNDPGASFFGVLEQRQATAADFAPDSINHPETRIFNRGALGLDLALYEGGAKQAQVKMMDHLASAGKLESAQVEVEQYSQVGLIYGTIASLEKQTAKLHDLDGQVTKLVRGYQLGQKSNPVGYSGLLGLKSLSIRISGLLEQLEAQKAASYKALSEMGVRELNWTPEKFDAREFTSAYLSSARAQDVSRKSLANLEEARATSEGSKMERARERPRVGVFAETYAFKGSRDTATGTTAGVYIQWNLFDPTDHGKSKEAQLNAQGSERAAQASLQQETVERVALFESGRALRANLTKLDESEGLLSEQMRVSSTLFRSGAIGALQLVEILNRRTDLITQQTEAELSLLKTSATLVSKSNFEIPDIALNGGKK